MGRVGGRAISALESQGDLEYGGAGTPTSYVNALRDGEYSVALIGKTTPWAPAGSLWDGNTTTNVEVYLADFTAAGADAWFGADLGAPRRIGRFRIVQAIADSYAPTWVLESADAAAGPWTTRYTLSSGFQADYSDELPAPITARYWRFRATSDSHGGAGSWIMREIELDAVTTVGAGNPTRLAPPDERRLLGYDPAGGVPEWALRYAAIADLAATTGVDVAAATGTQVATTAELEATNTKVNAILAALRDRGLLDS